jgi:hypothetical protein
MKWRVITEDSPNQRVAPWTDATGIEEADDVLAVPAIVCWFTRGSGNGRLAQYVVDLHNQQEDKS